MKEEEESYAKTAAAAGILKKEASSCSYDSSNNNNGLLGRNRYKFWALAAILLLAVWSIFTGSVTLKWSSAGGLHPIIDDFDSPLQHDLDILEVEDREKVVRHMWDIYSHSRTIRLPKFWRRAFVAAYEDLTSDVPVVRNAAVSEIAKMSLVSLDTIEQSSPVQSAVRALPKRAAKDKKALPVKTNFETSNPRVSRKHLS